MAVTVKNAKLDSRNARAKLAERREPYWQQITAGRHLGYRKGVTGGTWIAKLRADDGRRHIEALGAADDILDADGHAVLNFTQAQERARQFFTRKTKELAGDFADAGPYTVAAALEDYFAHRERRGAKGLPKDRAAASKRITPALGKIDVTRLTTRQIRDWHTSLAEVAGPNSDDPDIIRARRATANRTLTVLKAALNNAFHEGRVISDDAWRKVRPFHNVDTPVVQFLTDDESRRLVNACEGAFRDLVRAALTTGCRYGELTRMRTSDFNAEAGTITVRESKNGKPRHVALTDEGKVFFTRMTAGKAARDLIFIRDDGEQWGPSHQQRPIAEASARAKIEPAATFHILRHSYASTLAMRGVPMGVIAAQLGHADTRMTERHYAHLAPNYVAETVRAALPALGIIDDADGKISTLKIAKGA